MKRLLFLILPILFLASCTGGHVDGYTVSNQGTWVPVKDSTGKIISNTLVYKDTTVDIVPFFTQKVKIAAHHGGLAVFIIFNILALALLIFGFIQTTKPQKNDYLNILWPILAIICFCIAFGSVGWTRGKVVEMPKTTYDSIIVNHGDLKSAIEPLIYK